MYLHTLQHAAPHCTAMQRNAARCTTIQHAGRKFNTLPHTATHQARAAVLPQQQPTRDINIFDMYVLAHTATRCTTLHRYICTCTHCNTLQRAVPQYTRMQRNAAQCTIIQHAARQFNTLQHTATHCNTPDTRCCFATMGTQSGLST